MNILYISKLSGIDGQGPTYSVPMQISAQSQYDNVFWYNMNMMCRSDWNNEKVLCHTMKEYPSGRLADLPKPFDKPDLVVIQQCYSYAFSPMIADIRKKRIPYVIVPRSSLTKGAQQLKRVKKFIGNLVYFNSFVNHAAAIHYLTKEEKRDSEDQWRVPSFVIPNGISTQEEVKTSFSENGIKGLYIGRIRLYQKGLDIMIRVMAEMQDELRNARFTMELYGTDHQNAAAKLTQMATDLGISDLVHINGPVFEKEKHQKLLSADVFVMTSTFEGHPMGMIEALAYGLPCIATRGTNLAEQIEKYDAGWNAGTTFEDIKMAFKRMLADKGEFERKGKNALCLSYEYEWDKIAKESHDIYERIVKGV